MELCPLEVLSTLQIQPRRLDVYAINLEKASDKLPHFLLHWICSELTRTLENEEAAWFSEGNRVLDESEAVSAFPFPLPAGFCQSFQKAS